MNSIYQWQGINAHGQRIHGENKSKNSQQLFSKLNAQGITVLKIKKHFSQGFSRPKKITRHHLADFTRQIATLCQANLDLVQALQIIAKEDSHASMQSLIIGIKQHIENGMSFAHALSQFPQYFDKIYCGLVSAGEQSGTLNTMLNQLAVYQEQMLNLRAKIAKTLFYPTTIIAVAILITCGLLIFVVPQFKNIFNNFGAELPVFTQWVIAISNILRGHFLALLGTGAAIVIGIKILIKHSHTFALWKDQQLLRLPICGHLLTTAIMARWTRLLATLLAAGIPLVDALQTSTHTIPNRAYQQTMIGLTDTVSSGATIAQALQANAHFPRRMVQMIMVGENCGQLATMLAKIAEQQQQVLDHTIDYFSKWLEPAIMILLAIITGALIIAMYLPVFRLGAVL